MTAILPSSLVQKFHFRLKATKAVETNAQPLLKNYPTQHKKSEKLKDSHWKEMFGVPVLSTTQGVVEYDLFPPLRKFHSSLAIIVKI